MWLMLTLKWSSIYILWRRQFAVLPNRRQCEPCCIMLRGDKKKRCNFLASAAENKQYCENLFDEKLNNSIRLISKPSPSMRSSLLSTSKSTFNEFQHLSDQHLSTPFFAADDPDFMRGSGIVEVRPANYKQQEVIKHISTINQSVMVDLEWY